MAGANRLLRRSIEATTMTVWDFFHDIYRIYHPRLKSRNSVGQYESAIRVVDRYWRSKGNAGPVCVSDLSAELVLGAASSLVRDPKAPRSPATANRLISTIAAIWREAAKRSGAPPVPDDLPEYDVPKRAPVAWSPEELAKMLAEAAKESGYIGPVPASSWFSALLLFVYWTGARITAVMSTRVAALDVQTCTVKIDAEHQKHNADGTYDLPRDLVECLQSFGAEARGLQTLFGDWPYDRGQVGWRALNRRLEKVLIRAGLPTTRRDKFHKIRRTFATQITAKRGIAVAQQMLGHSTLKVTEAYVDPRFVPRPKATEILDAPCGATMPTFRIVG
jgi:integrase